MLILVLLLVNEWAAEAESEMALFILLVEHRVYLSYVASVDLNNVKFFRI